MVVAVYGRRARYGAVAVLLHWLIALLLFINLGLGLRFAGLHGPERIRLIQFHKSLGITILLLVLLRLGWRLRNPPPPFPKEMRPWERNLARPVHILLYALLLLVPLTGWAVASASPLIRIFPIDMFGLFKWPAIPFLERLPAGEMQRLHDALRWLHADLLKFVLIAVIGFHVAAALRHLALRDGTFARMLP